MSILKELWHGNVCPQTDSRKNSPEMKELMEYMARHHDDLLKTMTDEQKEIFEKFDDLIVGVSTRAAPKNPSSNMLVSLLRTMLLMQSRLAL